MDLRPIGFFSTDEMIDVKKGPWTEEEDALLVNCVTSHGEGRWNAIAHVAGLKRSGKSCRLRWLNYLRPDLRRGNMSLEEQLLILELHCRWGNRWAKIAQYLPGRTDNEIKNYWRTRVQKQAKQLQCDVNSKQFRDTLQYVWMPRLREQIQSSGKQQALVNTHTNNQAIQITSPSSSTLIPQVSGCTSNDDSSVSTHVVFENQWNESFADNEGSGTVVYDGCSPWEGDCGEETLMMMDYWCTEEKLKILKQHLFDDDF